MIDPFLGHRQAATSVLILIRSLYHSHHFSRVFVIFNKNMREQGQSKQCRTPGVKFEE